MAKYTASPFYAVKSGEKSQIKFDYKGEYSTEKKAEIEVLDALCPVWIKRIDEPKSEAKPKASAKSSGK